ncbi:MAG: ABC transporter permease [Desulfobulbaceae bacterium]|nr:ABC transporter permease [Desulfobulbaceae bacterium]
MDNTIANFGNLLKIQLKQQKQLDLIIAYGLAALTMTYLSYSLPNLLPGDFVTTMYSNSFVTITAEQEAELRNFYSTDAGFGDYIIRLLKLDWGFSYSSLTPVSSLFFSALPWTLLLMGSANFISIFIGFVTGVEAAWQRDSKTEKTMVSTMTIMEGIPEICTGVILLAIFSLHYQWFPAAGAETAYANHTLIEQFLDVAHHLALPLLSLIFAYLPGNFLMARNSMVMVLKQSYITTARAKGLSALRIRYAHAARNALLPVVTRFCLRLSFMVTGALVVERIHSYPGLGTLLFNAIQARDLPVIQAVVLVSSLMVLAIILSLELLYGIIDPRVTHAH